jgi:hypothetical protein
MYRNLISTKALVLVAGLAMGCLGGQQPTGNNPSGPDPVVDPSTDPGTGPAGATTPTVGGNQGDPLGNNASQTGGSPDNTFDHMNESTDPFEVLKRFQSEGAPEVAVRMHSCSKIRYSSLGTVLTGIGVNLTTNAAQGQPQTAGQLYRGAGPALGAPNYGARIGEAVELTTAGATKLFDIFVQAASQVITALPNVQRCQVNGTGVQMFDAQGKCNPDAITCILGMKATQDQVDLCNSALNSASTPDLGKRIAVGSLLAAVHTCE